MQGHIVFLIQNEMHSHTWIFHSEGKTTFTVTKMTVILPYSSLSACDINCRQTG